MCQEFVPFVFFSSGTLLFLKKILVPVLEQKKKYIETLLYPKKMITELKKKLQLCMLNSLKKNLVPII